MGIVKPVASIILDKASIGIPVYDYSGRELLRFSKFFKKSESVKGSILKYVLALDRVSFNLNSGARLGIVGANGAGKSTLLRLLSGIYTPTSGSIKIDGKVTSLLDITFGIEPDLTGRESIDLRAKILNVPNSLVVKKKEEIISFSGLGEFIDLPTRTYSSGMYVRLAFSIATILNPEILIMDEWLSVGDAEFRKRAEEKLDDLVAKTEILILASHSRTLLEKTCNVVLYLDKGRSAGYGETESVCESYFSNLS